MFVSTSWRRIVNMRSILISLTLVIITFILYLYTFFKKAYRYFDEKGIPNLRPRTFLGNLSDVFLLRRPLAVAHLELYRKLAPHGFAGFYTLHKPSIMVRDPDLIRQVLTKDFIYFTDRGFDMDTKIDPLGSHLFVMKGEREISCSFQYWIVGNRL